MTKKKQTFETAMERLEEITRQLEETEVSLEKSVSLYQEGLTLRAFCQEKLAEAEGAVLIMEEKEGVLTEAPFRAEEAES